MSISTAPGGNGVGRRHGGGDARRPRSAGRESHGQFVEPIRSLHQRGPEIGALGAVGVSAQSCCFIAVMGAELLFRDRIARERFVDGDQFVGLALNGVSVLIWRQDSTGRVGSAEAVHKTNAAATATANRSNVRIPATTIGNGKGTVWFGLCSDILDPAS
jgi:hypothetical protein